jgi:hypothetical protein
MARISGATLLLILVATVSVYTCAIFAGAALSRALDRPTRAMTKQPPARDIALRVSVSLRGLAEDFAKVIIFTMNVAMSTGRSSLQDFIRGDGRTNVDPWLISGALGW